MSASEQETTSRDEVLRKYGLSVDVMGLATYYPGALKLVEDHAHLRTQLTAAEREIVSLTEIARCETAFAMAARTRAEQIEAENQILCQKIKDLTFIIENPKP